MTLNPETAQDEDRTLRDVIKEQGRSYVWLARQTGYSPEHVQKVASGGHPGTVKFWKAVSVALGEELCR